MKNFFEIIAAPVPLEPSEYIAGLSTPFASTAQEMLSTATAHLAWTHAKDETGDPLPEIRIESINGVDGGAIPGRIVLTHGLIELCGHLSVPVHLYNELHLPAGLAVPISEFSLTFALIHEYTHIKRKHNASAEVIGDSDRVSRAMEHDADLCAAASVYRLAQMKFGHVASDIQIRSLVLFTLYWFMINCPRSTKEEVQGTLPERLFGIFLKLTSIGRAPTDPADPDCLLPETTERAGLLMAVLCRLAPFSPEILELIKQTLQGIESGDIHQPTRAWDEIRTTVGDVSNTLT